MILRKIIRKSWRAKHYSSNTADTEHIIYTNYPPIVTIGINNPDYRNALNETIVKELKDALTRFENDETALVGVLFGEGGNFCSGYDLKELATRTEDIPKHFIENDLTKRYLRKPLIAAVNGYAVGAGFDLALMCDMRVMESAAVFGYYGRRFGASVSHFGIQRLSAMVGFSKAMDLVLTGRPIKSEEALKIGIANRIAECGTVIGQGVALAQDISKFPQAAILNNRAMLYKLNFPHLGTENEKLEDDILKTKEKMIEDIKRGSKLFAEAGVGKKGSLFSKYLWDKT